jgi:hypothetical protein
MAYGALVGAAAYTGLFEVAVVGGTLGMITGAAILYQNLRLGRVMYHVLEICAKAIDLQAVPEDRQ